MQLFISKQIITKLHFIGLLLYPCPHFCGTLTKVGVIYFKKRFPRAVRNMKITTIDEKLELNYFRTKLVNRPLNISM